MSHDPRPSGRAPCRHACPVDQNAKEYVALIAEGRFRDSLEVIRRTNPFASVCGRVCTHPCERECVRAGSGGAVAVRWLKRFVADRAADEGSLPPAGPFDPWRTQRVAVVGAGPAGLTAALDLASLGYGTTVLEARDEPGGMMRWGIPEFRLPRHLVRLETRAVEEAGVRIVTGFRLGRDGDLDDLLAGDHAAVLIAAGAGRQSGLPIEGDSGEGVADTLAFMETGTVAGRPLARMRVVVVGATREGFDAARLAARQGARSVVLVTHLEHDTWDGSVVEALEADGVRIMDGIRPVAVRRKAGRIEALEVRRVSGRGRNVTIPASIVLPAADRHVDPGLLDACRGVQRGPWGIIADPRSLATSRSGVFAAGDAVTGPRNVIEAVAAGHRAASAIHESLSGETWQAAGRPWPPSAGPEAWEITAPSHPALERSAPLSGPAMAMREARRCLRCGQCLDCETCHPDCPTRVAMLALPGSRTPSWTDPLIKIDEEVVVEVLGGGPIRLGDDPPREPVVPVPVVDASACLGCGRCADACPYDVVQMTLGADGAGIARIHAHACRACGSCAGACPVDAIDQPYWSHDALDRAVDGRSGDVVLACRWGEDAPASAVPLPCAGRAGERVLLRAAAAGASSVDLRDCGDACRYRTGRACGQAALARVETVLERLGLEAGRLSGNDVAPMESGDGHGRSVAGPFARPMLDVERLLARSEITPVRRPLVHDLRVADRADVLLHSGCLPFIDALAGNDVDPCLAHGLRSAVRLLNRSGIVPALTDDERSCGLDLRGAGDGEAYLRLAALGVEAIERTGARVVVTTCGEAVHALAAQVKAARGSSPLEVVHLALFLDEMQPEPPRAPAGAPAVAVLDDPADPAVRRAASRLLRSAGLRPVRWKPPRHPVREAHGQGTREDALAVLEAARSSGASIVACTSLRRSLGAMYVLRQGGWDGFGVRVMDLASLLAGGGP
ncbi:MAG: FAD-dependent oxidoreductase [Deltaproteobacteria bacterium]|nr:FAD-dependent oxidoreductase [Deltaproteobacteria bacterium]